jgi:hypothetical protein
LASDPFTSAASRILLPVLEPMGFRLQTHVSGRLCLAEYASTSHVVSVSYEPGDDYWVVVVYSVRDGVRSDYDDPAATPRLGDLNARFLTQEDGATLRELRKDEAKEPDEVSRRFRRIAGELAIVLPRYISSSSQPASGGLGHQESVLSGAWIDTESGPMPDDTCRRIEALTRDHLKKLATDSSGWSTLYRDPDDGRLWELAYLQSSFPGGGPPTLRLLTHVQAAARYGRLNLGPHTAEE